MIPFQLWLLLGGSLDELAGAGVAEVNLYLSRMTVYGGYYGRLNVKGGTGQLMTVYGSDGEEDA